MGFSTCQERLQRIAVKQLPQPQRLPQRLRRMQQEVQQRKRRWLQHQHHQQQQPPLNGIFPEGLEIAGSYAVPPVGQGWVRADVEVDIQQFLQCMGSSSALMCPVVMPFYFRDTRARSLCLSEVLAAEYRRQRLQASGFDTSSLPVHAYKVMHPRLSPPGLRTPEALPARSWLEQRQYGVHESPSPSEPIDTGAPGAWERLAGPQRPLTVVRLAPHGCVEETRQHIQQMNAFLHKRIFRMQTDTPTRSY